MYTLSLNQDELNTLYWLAHRGYFPEEILRGMSNEDEPQADNAQVVYTMPEHVAWSLTELREDDPDAYLACLGGDLLDKILQLESEIV